MARTRRDAIARLALLGGGATMLALLPGCALFQPRFNAHVPPPARPVDLTRYLGTWYEMARYDSSFEHDCEAAMAVYRTRPDGLIAVENSCRAADGSRRVAYARAYVQPGTANTRLKLSFFGPFFVGTYWVLDHADDYAWTIVGEPSGGYLWILTRARHPDAALRASLIARAATLGYNIARLHQTAQ